MVRSLGCLLALLLTASLAAPLQAQKRHQDLFRAGLRAYDLGFWRESLLYFEAAAEAQPVARGNVRQYGMWSVPYQPYFYQCLALIELGLYVEALRVLEIPEAGLGPREDEKLPPRRRRQIRRLTEEIRRRLHLDALQLSRSAAEDHATIEALARRIPDDPQAGGPHLETAGLLDLASIEELLETSESLRKDSLLASAEQLAAARVALDRSREAIEEIHQRLLEFENLVSPTVDDQLRERRLEALEALALARDLVSIGTCSPAAIEVLEKLELEGWPSLSPSADEVVYPRARLLRAYLECGWLALARVLLDQERDEETLPPELLRELEQELEVASAAAAHEEAGTPKGGTPKDRAPRAPGEEIGVNPAADFLELAVTSRLGICQGQALDRRLEKLAPRLAEIDPSTLPRLGIEDVPHLVGARDAWTCEDLDRLERHLDALGREPRAPEALALSRWLAQQQRLLTGGHALLVAAADYSSALGWPTLRSPQTDIQEVSRTLEAHGFEIETLENPTFEVLQETLDSFFFRHGNDPEKRLVFYYAGHGHTEQTRHGVKLGFLVPVDAGHPRNGREHLRNLFGMERFREYAIRSNATDMLFMFDSCFAGTVFRATRSCLPPACQPAGSGVGLEELIARPVRMFLTAGDETQKVPDQSLFRLMVTRALEGEGDLDRDRWILGRELGSFVRDQVTTAQQRLRSRFLTAELGPPPATPQWGTLTEAEFGQGDLVFRAPANQGPPIQSLPRPEHERELALELRYWRAARASGGAQGFDRLLERFPRGVFSALARSWPRGRP